MDKGNLIADADVSIFFMPVKPGRIKGNAGIMRNIRSWFNKPVHATLVCNDGVNVKLKAGPYPDNSVPGIATEYIPMPHTDK